MTRASYRKIFILVLAAAVTALFLTMVRDFVVAVLLAAVFAGLLYPVYRFMLGIRVLGRMPGTTAAAVVVLAAVALGLPFAGFVGLVSTQAVSVAESVVPWVRVHLVEAGESDGLPGWVPFRGQIEPHRDMILDRLGEAGGELAGFFVRSGTALTRGTLRFLLNLFVMLYAMYFFLRHGPGWISGLSGYLPLTDRDRVQVFGRGLAVTRATLKGVLIIGVLQGALIGAAFWVLGIGGAIFWGTIVVVLSALPAVGPAVVWVPAALYLFLDGRVIEAIGLTLWGAILVGLLDNVLRPRIIGAETKLPDLLIFLSMLGGISMFGVIGLLLGPVIAAVMVTTLDIYRYAFIKELPREALADDGRSEWPPARGANRPHV